MPDEEMDIMTDFGPDGFTEDIDIDLDLAAVAHPDEDLELADFDHSADLQLFNSDGRDELMAEGDDASYGMVDADDGEHVEVMATTDDIDIDLVALESDTAWHNGESEMSSHMIQEIDFVDADQNEEVVQDAETKAGSTTADADSPFDDPTKESDTQLAKELDPGTSEDTKASLQQTAELQQGQGRNDESTTNADKEKISFAQLDGFPNTIDGGTESSIMDENPRKEAPAQSGIDVTSLDVTEVPSTNVSPTDSRAVIGETSQSAFATDAKNIDDEQIPSELRAEPSEQTFDPYNAAPSDSKPHAESTEQDVTADDQEPENGLQPTTDHTSELIFEDIDENTGAQEQFEEADPASPGALNDDDEPDQAINKDDGLGLTQAITEHSSDSQPVVPDPVSQQDIAAVVPRHRPIISYKRTDYSLLAESDDDDPDTFFLKDIGTLNGPLDQFLTALRQVISTEISPLDELVLYIDGLGLEFAESSSPSLLNEHTFLELLELYDQLTRNDGAETVPPFYSYLSVRPSGAQRLLALKESAKAGHGFSQVAVYREFTPDEDHDEMQSHSDLDAASNAEEQYEEDVVTIQDRPHVEQADDRGPLLVNDVEGEDFVSQAQPHATEEAQAATADDPDVEGTLELDDELDLSSAHEDEPVLEPQHDEGALAELDQSATQEPLDEVPDQSASHDADATASAGTSATLTANGDDADEIGYSDDEDEDAAVSPTTVSAPLTTKTTSTVLEGPPPDDEITWESDHEDAVDENNSSTVQVSPVAGKRTRSDSIDAVDTSAQNDVKRQRS